MKNNNICKFPNSELKELSVSCFVSETNRDMMLQKTRLKHNRMILIEHGEGVFLFDNATCPFSPGNLIFGFENETFSLLSGENVSYIYIDFDGLRGKALCHRFGIYPHTRKNDSFNSLIPFCKNCLVTTKQENVDIASESILLYVFSRLHADAFMRNDTIQQIIEFTEDHFQSSDLSITVIAKKIGYNPKYLSHFFKEKMKITYSEYLRSYRLKYSISLFELGISSVKNVALLSGFSDPLYFSNSFKKAIGISPKEFILKQSENIVK